MNIILSKKSINWKKNIFISLKQRKQRFSKQWSETTLKYNTNHYFIHYKKSRQYLQLKRIKLQALNEMLWYIYFSFIYSKWIKFSSQTDPLKVIITFK